MTDDIYSLLSWCVDQQLKAHLKAHRYSDNVAHYPTQKYFQGKESAYGEIINKIQNGRVSQRPHVKGG
jgi:hypothetical protein